MVNENLIPQTETVYEVYELKNEIPSYEEFMKNYKSDKAVEESYWLENQFRERGYGPCGDDDKCSCSCRWKDGCSCVWHYEKVGHKDGDWEAIVGKGSVQGKADWGGLEVGFEDSKSIFRKKNSYEETKYLSSSAGGTINLSRDNVSVKGKVGFDIVNYESEDGFQARLGLSAETGASIGEDGVEIKFLGTGFSLGKKNEISTPLGRVSCSNQ